jgi:hypothetical protein
VQGPRQFPENAIQIGWLYAMDHRIQILVRGPESLEGRPEGVGIRAVRLRPACGQLNTGDGVVTTADSDAIASVAVILVGTAIVASIAADVRPLTCAHALQL